jgi:tetratricopeptide (TPR) repeat protein
MPETGTARTRSNTRAIGGICRISHHWSLASARVSAPALSAALLAALLAVVGVSIDACGNSGPSAPRASIATTLAAGSAALRQRNYWAAEQLFGQVIKRDPRQVAGYYDLGVAYQAQHDYRDALRAYARAQALDEDFVPVIYNRALLYSGSDPQLAMFLYRRAISLQHDSPTAFLNLGLLEASQGPLLRAQAEKDLATAVKLMPSLADRIPPGLRAGLSSPGHDSAKPRGHRDTAPSPAQS